MTTASFLLRAGISLAILSALPLFANANASLMGVHEHSTPAVATTDFSKVAQRAIATAEAETPVPSTTQNSAMGFTGNYSGTGQAADSNGWDSPCTTAAISISDTADSVTLSNANYECGSLGAHHDPVQLLKKSDGLYLGTQKVGAYSPTEIDAMLPFEKINDLSYVVRLLKKGDGVVYTEDWLSLQDNAYDQVFEMGSTLAPSNTNLR